jgi:hypothetical protein
LRRRHRRERGGRRATNVISPGGRRGVTPERVISGVRLDSVLASRDLRRARPRCASTASSARTITGHGSWSWAIDNAPRA